MEISENLRDHFKDFMEIVPARRMQREIDMLLLSYLQHELKVGKDKSFDDMVCDLKGLLNFLLAIESECDQSELL